MPGQVTIPSNGLGCSGMNGNNQVTVRINGKEQMEKDTELAADKEMNPEFQWRLPEEKILKQRALKQAGKQRKKPLGGRAPSLPLRRKKKRAVPAPKKINRKNKFPKNQWLSGVFAVVVGVIMGMLVLSIFTNPPHHKQGHSGQKNQLLQKTNTSSEKNNGGFPAASQLDLNFNVVQGGVFSTDANGQAAEGKLRNKGFAAILNHKDGKIFMYIGVANNKKQAEDLANLYKQKGQDVWVKPFSIHVNSNQLDKQTSKILGETKPALIKLIQASGTSLADGKPSFSKKDLAKIQNQLQMLKQSAGSTNKLAENLDQARQALAKYRSDSSVSELWKAEQSLLNAIGNYEKTGAANH